MTEIATAREMREAAARVADAEGWTPVSPLRASDREEGAMDCADRIAASIRAIPCADSDIAADIRAISFENKETVHARLDAEQLRRHLSEVALEVMAAKAEVKRLRGALEAIVRTPASAGPGSAAIPMRRIARAALEVGKDD